MNEWEIIISNFQGLVPAFWQNTIPSYGNKGQASAMDAIDQTDPNRLTQGPGLVDLTNGNESGAVTTLIKGMLRTPFAIDETYGIGGNKLYKISSTAVNATSPWPHTIDKAAVDTESGEDVCEYGGYVFYSYNHSGSHGDVGRLTPATNTFDDDFMSTVPTGAAALQGSLVATNPMPHQMMVGGDGVLYIANGRYIASYDLTTFVDQALDLPVGSVVSSIAWNANQIYAGVNRPNFTGFNQNESSIYIWDPTQSSWNYEIKVLGRIGGLYAKNGIVYVFYQDVWATGVYKLGYVSGNAIIDLAFFTGTLPDFHQVSEHKNHLLWATNGTVWAWGAPAPNLPTKLFAYTTTGYSIAGGLSNVFGTPFFSSQTGSSYRLAIFSGYSILSTWNSILFDVSSAKRKTYLDRVVVWTEQLGAGAALDSTLTYDYGKGSKTLSQIALDGLNTTKHTILRDSIEVDNFRLDFSWANGSAVNPATVRKIAFHGIYSDDA